MRYIQLLRSGPHPIIITKLGSQGVGEEPNHGSEQRRPVQPSKSRASVRILALSDRQTIRPIIESNAGDGVHTCLGIFVGIKSFQLRPISCLRSAPGAFFSSSDTMCAFVTC